jgi:hypothetical protein
VFKMTAAVGFNLTLVPVYMLKIQYLVHFFVCYNYYKCSFSFAQVLPGERLQAL